MPHPKDNAQAEDETLKDKPKKWGGARPGSGRPKGSMNQATKDRLKIKTKYQERIAKVADHIFNSQYNLATGEQYLFWKHKEGTGAKARTVTEIITSKQVVIDYLNGDLDEGEDEYYYISTKPANGMALDSMLDRAFGKADSKLDLTTNGESLNGIDTGRAEQLLRARRNRANS